MGRLMIFLTGVFDVGTVREEKSRLHMALPMFRYTEHVTSIYSSGIQSTEGGESEKLEDDLLVEEQERRCDGVLWPNH